MRVCWTVTVDINLPMRKCLKTSLFAIFVIFTSLTSENTEVSKNMFNIEGVSRTLLVLFSFCHFAKCVFLYFWLDYHFTKVLKRTPSLDDTERKRRSISFRFSINLQYMTYLAWSTKIKFSGAGRKCWSISWFSSAMTMAISIFVFLLLWQYESSNLFHHLVTPMKYLLWLIHIKRAYIWSGHMSLFDKCGQSIKVNIK